MKRLLLLLSVSLAAPQLWGATLIVNSVGLGPKNILTGDGSSIADSSLSTGDLTIYLGYFNGGTPAGTITGTDYAAMFSAFNVLGTTNATSGSGDGEITANASGEILDQIENVTVDGAGFAPTGTSLYLLVTNDRGTSQVNEWGLFNATSWTTPADPVPGFATFFTADVDTAGEIARGIDNGTSLQLAQVVPEYTWDGGGGDDNHGTGANWVGDNAPVLGSILHFAGSTRTTPNNNYGNFDNMAQIIFDAGASSFTLGGNSVKLQDNSGFAPFIRNDSTNTQTIEWANIAWDSNGRIFAEDGDIVLSLDGGASPGDGSLFLDNSANLILEAASGRTITVNNSINNAGGSVTIDGAGTSIFNSTSSNYDGGTTINNGTLQLGASGVIPDSGTVSVNGGTLDVNGNSETAGAVTLQSGTITDGSSGGALTSLSDFDLQSGTVSANLGGGVKLRKTTAGTVTIQDVASSYTGNTEIDAGTLQVGENGGLPGGSTVFVGNGGTTGTAASFLISDADGGTTVSNNISVNPGDGTNRTVGASNTSGTNTFAGTVDLTESNGSENRSANVFADTGGTVEFSGAISGTSDDNVTKTGGGTVVFSNNSNTYTGSTTVSQGTLQIDGSISSGPVSVSSGATLSGSGTVGGNTTLNGNAVLDPIGSLDFGGDLDIAGDGSNGRFLFDLASDTVNLSSGTLSIGAGLLDFSDFIFLNGMVNETYTLFSSSNLVNGSLGASLSGSVSGFAATLSLDGSGQNVILSVAPETSTALPMLVVLMLGIFGHRRRK